MTRGQAVVLFRLDANVEIGSGHLMRCLTLANALKRPGVACLFAGAAMPASWVERIEAGGHAWHPLPADVAVPRSEAGPADALAQALDAAWCARLLAPFERSFVVVDHYGLDAAWERAIEAEGSRLLAIDDLADREHVARFLVDPNLGRTAQDYAGLVEPAARLEIGPAWASLRPEFARLRTQAQAKRSRAHGVQRVLITFGGSDNFRLSLDAVRAVLACAALRDASIDVVFGTAAPWLPELQALLADRRPHRHEIAVNATDMAQRMLAADLCIGAAGSTCWERCCLGLPSIQVTVAANQVEASQALEARGAAISMPREGDMTGPLERALAALATDSARLAAMAQAAFDVTDGLGATRLSELILGQLTATAHEH